MRSVAAALLLLTSAPGLAAPLHLYDGLAMAPLGDRVASIESNSIANEPKSPHGQIVVRSALSGAIFTRIDPCAACRYSGLAFAPDGRLAFLARQGGVTRLMLSRPEGTAAPTVLATISGVAQDPRWSPDATQLSLLATVGARKEAGATQAGVRQVGEIGEQNDEQRIAVVPTRGGPLRFVSPADRYVYEYDWLPDGRGFVVTSAQGNGDNNWWIATLDRIDIGDGSVRNLAAP
jgi:dipeptidyl aminopeptidase/acylaminoacyl peptidase